MHVLCNNAAELVLIQGHYVSGKIYFSLCAHWASTAGKMGVHWGEGSKDDERGGKTQARCRDNKMGLHCQSGEAINNFVTAEQERGKEWRSRSRVYERNTTKPWCNGCFILPGTNGREKWVAQHSSPDGSLLCWQAVVLMTEHHTLV